jgi:hypothetical protein
LVSNRVRELEEEVAWRNDLIKQLREREVRYIETHVKDSERISRLELEKIEQTKCGENAQYIPEKDTLRKEYDFDYSKAERGKYRAINNIDDLINREYAKKVIMDAMANNILYSKMQRDSIAKAIDNIAPASAMINGGFNNTFWDFIKIQDDQIKMLREEIAHLTNSPDYALYRMRHGYK